jgi:trk system potassium uptake protein TrkH
MKNGFSLSESFRLGVFQLVSAITTTGYQTILSFQAQSSIFIGFVIILMIVGGSIGSTSGGIKQYRVAVLLKSMYWNIQERLTNHKIIRTHYINKAGKKVSVSNSEVMYVHQFIGIYLFLLLIGTLIICAFGYSLQDSLFEFASALGTVGLSIGITSYTTHPVILWVLTLGMFLGRLEIYIVLIVILKGILSFRKKE